MMTFTGSSKVNDKVWMSDFEGKLAAKVIQIDATLANHKRQCPTDNESKDKDNEKLWQLLFTSIILKWKKW